MRNYPGHPKANFKRAVFLDRDGTINVDTHFPYKVQDLKMIPEAIEGVKILSNLPFDLIIISNQSGIALNLFTEGDMTLFNQELIRQLENHQGRIDGIYYCPHKEMAGNLGCSCSKPQPGLLIEAATDFEIDLTNSFMIGDKTSDILAGQRAGCKTILVRTGKAGQEQGAFEVTPDYTADHLLGAAQIISSLIEGQELS